MRKDLLEEAAFMLEKLANRLEERMQESFEMLDRIEALEAALRWIANTMIDSEVIEIALAALAGEQDK